MAAQWKDRVCPQLSWTKQWDIPGLVEHMFEAMLMVGGLVIMDWELMEVIIMFTTLLVSPHL